jgi:predicted lysophospholipase L1 biosynthesis ABC-type transport system permease subunit
MKAGVTLRQATDDLTTVTARFNKENGVNRSVRVWRLHEYLSQTNRQMLLVLQGAVLLVLLVACAKVANMLLARSVSRRRELAIRLAIGADPMRWSTNVSVTKAATSAHAEDRCQRPPRPPRWSACGKKPSHRRSGC